MAERCLVGSRSDFILNVGGGLEAASDDRSPPTRCAAELQPRLQRAQLASLSPLEASECPPIDAPSRGCPVRPPRLEIFQSSCLFSTLLYFLPVLQLLTFLRLAWTVVAVAAVAVAAVTVDSGMSCVGRTVRRRAGETAIGPACSGHTVSSWQGRSWELFSRKRMGGSASH